MIAPVLYDLFPLMASALLEIITDSSARYKMILQSVDLLECRPDVWMDQKEKARKRGTKERVEIWKRASG